jgi:hypothetical protein
MEEVIGAGGAPYKGKNVHVPTPGEEPEAPEAAEVVEDVVEKSTKRIGKKDAG